ncbi:MAG: hypothetical protein FH751_07615 [Firmicutes bacterium]|nr:hypothetical protein [Bacillota bacterium]
MIKVFIIFPVLFFIIIAISTNRNSEYVKYSAFSILILSMINMISLVFHSINYGKYLGLFRINEQNINVMFNYSLFIALIALVIYLFNESNIKW